MPLVVINNILNLKRENNFSFCVTRPDEFFKDLEKLIFFTKGNYSISGRFGGKTVL